MIVVVMALMFCTGCYLADAICSIAFMGEMMKVTAYHAILNTLTFLFLVLANIIFLRYFYE